MEQTVSPDGRTSAGEVNTLGELCRAVPSVPAAMPLRDAERLFRNDPSLRAVAVETDDGPALLTLRLLEAQLSGRLGYGRALLSRARVGDLLSENDLFFDAGRSLREAAEVLLMRRDWLREDDVLVLHSDGRTSIASVAAIFRQIGLVFRDIAMRDPLTGLPNRRMLDDRGQQLGFAGADLERLAVLYVDMDGFKQVNDSFGHRAGDDVLVAFAQRLTNCVRPHDLIGRLGGDEFAVLLADIDEDEAIDIADRIVDMARAPFPVGARQVRIGASVGVATGREVAFGDTTLSTLDVLLHRADAAMLHAKRAGKARAATGRVDSGDAWSPSRLARISRRLQLALETGDLELHYQPKLDLRSGHVNSVEALVRWHDAELGHLAPSEFIPVAEHNGQILALGSWVLRAACAQARKWYDEGRNWAVAINVSPVQLAEGALLEDVLEAIAEADIPPHLLQIEVTETSAIDNMPLAVSQLTGLQELGVRVHLDDFGTGYSSIPRLRSLPVDTLKIDQSIVGRIDIDEADAQLLSGIIATAHALGLAVVAEGVERESQMARLRELGCDIVQGYLVSRPRPAGELKASDYSTA